jgi:hypothetical protein
MTRMQSVTTAPGEDSGRQPCYLAYQPETWERTLMRQQNTLVFQQPPETNSLSVWQNNRPMGGNRVSAYPL